MRPKRLALTGGTGCCGLLEPSCPDESKLRAHRDPCVGVLFSPAEHLEHTGPSLLVTATAGEEWEQLLLPSASLLPLPLLSPGESCLQFCAITFGLLQPQINETIDAEF